MRGTTCCFSVLLALVTVPALGGLRPERETPFDDASLGSGSGEARKAERGTMREKHKHRATGRTEVKTYVETTFDEITQGPALKEVRVKETFTGDIEGEGTARVIQAARQDGSAFFVGIERVRGSIAGRGGTFLLKVSGTVAGKEMHAEWSVVPGSGTGELTGLRGEGGFKAQLGEQGAVWLEYD